jgi:hypothetical protein
VPPVDELMGLPMSPGIAVPTSLLPRDEEY